MAGVAALVDMTEHGKLQCSCRELAHLARVSAMGELAGSLVHELNQPLTAILSNVQAAQRFMSEESIDLSEVRETLKDVVEAAKRASELIRRMCAFVKKGNLEFEPLEPNALVTDVVAILRSELVMRRVRVRLEVAPGLPRLRGDRVQLQQVILNLLLNAFDAMEDKPREVCEATLQVVAHGATGVRFSVRDCGTGLPTDKLDSIFKPFFTTKREGIGLGLSISRSIVTAHGGRLWVENNLGYGATFCFTLPAIGGNADCLPTLAAAQRIGLGISRTNRQSSDIDQQRDKRIDAGAPNHMPSS